MDLSALSDGLVSAKSGFDLLRGAVGLLKDVQGVLPAGDKKDAVGTSLSQASRQLELAEAQIAKGLGYPLCRCTLPPNPMLEVGEYWSPMAVRVVVNECPRCHRNDGPKQAANWIRSVPRTA
jgi:hypothetical protein